jgi:hypothetical protein
MSFDVETRWGGAESSPSAQRMREILAELDVRDDEHPDTWLEHESGWTLIADQSGRVVLENADSSGEPPRHMLDVSRVLMLELWLQLAAGNIDEVQRAPWQPGHGGPPMTEAEKAECDAAVLALDRRFYDSLGQERDQPRCAAPRCGRGAVQATLFCRVHQFENVKRKPCPFSH